MFKHILVATDGSKLAERATTDAVALAKSLDAKLTVITVILPWHIIAPAEVMVSFPEEEYLTGAKSQAEKILEKVLSEAKEAAVKCDTRHSVDEHPWHAITETALSEKCDLIIMGSHGRTGIEKLIMGSETQKVLIHSKIPVLVHR